MNLVTMKKVTLECKLTSLKIEIQVQDIKKILTGNLTKFLKIYIIRNFRKFRVNLNVIHKIYSPTNKITRILKLDFTENLHFLNRVKDAPKFQR